MPGLDSIISGALAGVRYFYFVLIFIIVFCTTWIVIRTISEYKKYGNSIFSNLKKRKKTGMKDILLSIVRKPKRYKRLFYLDNTKSIITVFDITGIYTITYFKGSGIIKGDVNDKMFIIDGIDNNKIANFIPLIESNYKYLKKTFPNEVIDKYVVIGADANFNISNTNIMFIKLQNLFVTLDKRRVSYTKREIDKMCDVIDGTEI